MDGSQESVPVRKIQAEVITRVLMMNVVMIHVVQKLSQVSRHPSCCPEQLAHVRHVGENLVAAMASNVNGDHPQLVDPVQLNGNGKDEYFNHRIHKHDDCFQPGRENVNMSIIAQELIFYG